MEYFPSGISEGMQHISESVFGRLCLIVGTSQEVAIRRATTDIEDIVSRHIQSNGTDCLFVMLSGSQREGFRLKGSDIDIMCWSDQFRVITDVFQSENYDITENILLLSDSSESPPGFTLLQVVTPEMNMNVNVDMILGTDIFLQSFIVRMNEKFYISCSGMKELLLSHSINDFFSFIAHGPCATVFAEGIGCDFAICFVCDFWPTSALSWIDRCHSWPAPEIVDEIVRGGCHFVAIGHPFGLHENMEWRISFSQAEQKCVNAMGHCQFLTYGLLKLFLKEVINQQCEETEELLCSYHIKTAILWVIQQNILSYWCPQNLLVGFWACFKLLLKWVYEGVCPNFFIPQNNLFLSKIYGSAQNSLFLKLHELYNKGIACLLQCSFIRSCIIDVLYNPRFSVCTDESVMKRESDFDVELFNGLKLVFTFSEENTGYVKTIYILEKLIGSPLTQFQSVHLQKLTVSCLQNSAAAVLHNMYNVTCFNKHIYIANKISGQMLKLAAKFGCVSDMLYIAMFYYKTYRYRKALSIIEMTKAKLARPYLMYNEHVDREMYIEVVGGKSWSTKMREAVACDIKLKNKISYIDELVPVQQFARQNGSPLEVEIPVFVFLHFIEFLCYRHIDRRLSQAALNELQVLVQYGHDPYVPDTQRDLSLQILGICQRMTRNL